MRSPNHITVAVRKPKGNIIVQEKFYQTMTQKHKWLNVPIVRGVVNLFEMMIIGTNAINYSANESIEEEEVANRKKKTWEKILDPILFAISFVLAMAISLFLFKFIPLWITTFSQRYFSIIADNYIVFNIIDGILKTLIFVSYIFLLSLIPSFRRIFEYHGAEHKSIYTYESNLPLTPENATKQTRFHPRCGTSFIVIVFVISILVYTFVPKQDTFLTNLLTRVAFLPLIAGISYEYLKLSAKYAKNTFVKALVAPGLLFQKLTTKEPDLKQLEVGLKSLQTALDRENVSSV